LGQTLIKLIDTRIDPPSEEWVLMQEKRGFEVLHLPALWVEFLDTKIDLRSFDTVFLASPRVVQKTSSLIKKFNGNVWAVGAGTAAALLKEGVVSQEVGDSSGAFFFLEALQDKYGKIPAKKIAWLSAETTAMDLDLLKEKFSLHLLHFPVYRTHFVSYNENDIKRMKGPKKWFFQSGRAVESMFQWIAKEDQVECVGRSATLRLKQLESKV